MKSKTAWIAIPGTLTLVVATVVTLSGCTQPSSSAESSPAATGLQYLLSKAPEQPMQVAAARESVKDNDKVVIVGRIGFGAEPWVEDQAVFDLMDSSLKACSDIEGDGCPIPWDYCCEDAKKIAKGRVLVKVVDQSGAVVKTEAPKLLGVKELQTVIVEGTAERNDAGNLVVMATGVYVKKS